MRTTIRTWAAAAEAATGLPFYETVNTEQDPADDIWWTLEFFAEYSEKLSFCDVWKEEGLCDLIVSGRPGIGDVAVIDAAEKIRDAILGNTDPTRKIYLVGPNPPSEFSGGSAQARWYQASVAIEYRYTN